MDKVTMSVQEMAMQICFRGDEWGYGESKVHAEKPWLRSDRGYPL